MDVIFGAAWGDEGKGKISARLAPSYDYVCRYNGGSNAGHTFYVDGQKVVTHLVPSGICYGKKSVIGPNCVVCVEDLLKELAALSAAAFDTNLVKISPKAHMVSNEHKQQDKELYSKKLGTTSRGIGPCYADKALRTGTRCESFLPDNFLWDETLEGQVLCEGAQSFWLDINQGNYPYVTSSECLPYSACSLGFSPHKIREIIAVAKMYDTRSGVDPYFDVDNEETQCIAKLGNEFGATTGRARQVKYLNLDKLIHSLNVSGATIVYLNKGDILEQAGVFKCYLQDKLLSFGGIENMKDYIESVLLAQSDVREVKFDFNEA